MAIGVSYGYMMFAITYAEIIMASFNLMATEAVMELQIRDHLGLEGDINEIIEFLAVFWSRPQEFLELCSTNGNFAASQLAEVTCKLGHKTCRSSVVHGWQLHQWRQVASMAQRGNLQYKGELCSRPACRGNL